MLQAHFQVILSDLSLDAPVRPWMPLCQNAICLTSPGAGACHPKRVVHLGMYRSFGHKLIVRYIFYNFRRVTTYIFIIINIVHMILTFKIVNTRFLMLPQWHHYHICYFKQVVWCDGLYFSKVPAWSLLTASIILPLYIDIYIYIILPWLWGGG